MHKIWFNSKISLNVSTYQMDYRGEVIHVNMMENKDR